MITTLKAHNKWLLKKLNMIRAEYGEPYDICGGLEIKNPFWRLIAFDSQKVKYKIIMEIL